MISDTSAGVVSVGIDMKYRDCNFRVVLIDVFSIDVGFRPSKFVPIQLKVFDTKLGFGARLYVREMVLEFPNPSVEHHRAFVGKPLSTVQVRPSDRSDDFQLGAGASVTLTASLASTASRKNLITEFPERLILNAAHRSSFKSSSSDKVGVSGGRNSITPAVKVSNSFRRSLWEADNCSNLQPTQYFGERSHYREFPQNKQSFAQKRTCGPNTGHVVCRR